MTEAEAEIVSVRALRPNNVYAWAPVLVALVRPGRRSQDSASWPGFVDRLLAWVPELAEHRCSVGRRGGFVERLHRGTYLPHIVEHVTLALQERMGFRVGFGRARAAREDGLYEVVVEYEEAEPARAALAVALRLVLAAIDDAPFDPEAETEALLAVADEHRLGPTTLAIVKAARALGVPTTRLAGASSLVQLGHGAGRRFVLASQTSATGVIAAELCQEKPMTNRMLRAVGVPVPDGRTVTDPDDAWRAALEIGVPVVVKPYAGNQGRGVSVCLRTEAEVRRAWELAREEGRVVLVERHVEGADHRLLVVGGRLVAAARRDPPAVTGDGVSTVAELVAAVNRDPRRRPGHGAPLTRIPLDGIAEGVLARQGLDRDAVPAKGQQVLLRTNANLSTGGTACDVTDLVHPETARMAELAAQIVGLDIAGVDLVVEDVSRPLAEQRGAIVEVNAAPGLRMHLAPTTGTPRDVGAAIVRMLFPSVRAARIPIVAVTGTNGKTTVTRLAAHLLQTARYEVGFTTTEGTFVGSRRILAGDCSGPRSAEAVLLHPQVQAAVLETARGGILREGLAFDECSVAVVTNVTADHLGSRGVDTVEELARVKQVVVEAVPRHGTAVLSAEDRLVAEMAAANRGRTLYFARDPGHPVLAAHLAAGEAGVAVVGGWITLLEGTRQTPVIELSRVPLTSGGRLEFQVRNVLAAAAAAWAVGVNPALVARGLSTFGRSPLEVPGRFNVLDVEGVELVLDYAHNEAAMEALGQAIDALGPRRTTLVFGLPGDRRDEDLRATARATARFANAWIVHDLADRRGRAPNEVPELLCGALPPGADCRTAPSSLRAAELALASARPGDRVVVIADDVDELLAALPELGVALGDVACGGAEAA